MGAGVGFLSRSVSLGVAYRPGPEGTSALVGVLARVIDCCLLLGASLLPGCPPMGDQHAGEPEASEEVGVPSAGRSPGSAVSALGSVAGGHRTGSIWSGGSAWPPGLGPVLAVWWSVSYG
jgi:hypothetical protein